MPQHLPAFRHLALSSSLFILLALLCACGEVNPTMLPQTAIPTATVTQTLSPLAGLKIEGAEELPLDNALHKTFIMALPWTVFLQQPRLQVYLTAGNEKELIGNTHSALVGQGYRFLLPGSPETKPRDIEDENGPVGFYQKADQPDILMAVYGVSPDPVPLPGQGEAEFARFKARLAGKHWMLVLAAAPGAAQAFTPVEGSGKFGSLAYHYAISPQSEGDFVATFQVPVNSATDVREWADGFNHIAGQYAAQTKSFNATLVFARPLLPDDYRDLARSAGMVVFQNILVDQGQGNYGVPPEYVKDSQGKQLFYTPQAGGDPLDPAIMARNLNGKRVGVVSAYVRLDKAVYEKIRRDQRIFAIDVSRQIVLDEVKKRFPSVAEEKVHLQDAGLWYFMEKYGLSSRNF